MAAVNRPSLVAYAWLSIAAAVMTISLKSFAYWVTGSVGLLSDAVESVVNLVGAGVALAMLTIAARPPDDDHLYGHCKAEYFASGVEGILIFAAAISIGVAAVQRLIHPKPLEEAFEGLIVCAIASLINFEVARILMYVGKKHNSITLEADAHHLMTDVWTSAAVIAGVGAVALTGWEPLDPIVALIVAANITWSGFQLIRRSVAGLMDAALPVEECGIVVKILEEYIRQGIEFHAFRTRQAGARRFISLHVLVPGTWTVIQGHQLLEQIEADIRKKLMNVTMFTHLEPIEDPTSLQDVELDR
jgi:cation diffusion facilitator family transporter